MNTASRKSMFLMKFRINRTRNGNALKLFVTDGTHKPYNQVGIVVDGITDVDALRRAVRTQLDWVVEDIVAQFIGDLQDARSRVEAIRIKEREYMRSRRQVTVDGGGNPEIVTQNADL